MCCCWSAKGPPYFKRLPWESVDDLRWGGRHDASRMYAFACLPARLIVLSAVLATSLQIRDYSAYIWGSVSGVAAAWLLAIMYVDPQETEAIWWSRRMLLAESLLVLFLALLGSSVPLSIACYSVYMVHWLCSAWRAYTWRQYYQYQ